MLLLADSITSFHAWDTNSLSWKYMVADSGEFADQFRACLRVWVFHFKSYGDRPKTRNTTNTTRWQKAVDTSRLRYLWHLVTSCDNTAQPRPSRGPALWAALTSLLGPRSWPREKCQERQLCDVLPRVALFICNSYAIAVHVCKIIQNYTKLCNMIL